MVGEIKKNRYVYYHCTGYKQKCPERYTREEVRKLLTVGILFAGSSSTGLIGTFAVFFVLGMAGVITVGVLHGRQLRGLPKTRGSQLGDSNPPV